MKTSVKTKTSRQIKRPARPSKAKPKNLLQGHWRYN